MGAPPSPLPTSEPCVRQCVAAVGKNQPECKGKAKDTCRRMMKQEGKCNWQLCVPQTPAPTPAPPIAIHTRSPSEASAGRDVHKCDIPVFENLPMGATNQDAKDLWFAFCSTGEEKHPGFLCMQGVDEMWNVLPMTAL